MSFNGLSRLGAPREILTEAHPHLGSDNLPSIVRAMRQEIISLGGSVSFHTKMTDLRFEDGHVAALETEDLLTGQRRWHDASCVILACGHSARDVLKLCAIKA